MSNENNNNPSGRDTGDLNIPLPIPSSSETTKVSRSDAVRLVRMAADAGRRWAENEAGNVNEMISLIAQQISELKTMQARSEMVFQEREEALFFRSENETSTDEGMTLKFREFATSVTTMFQNLRNTAENHELKAKEASKKLQDAMKEQKILLNEIVQRFSVLDSRHLKDLDT